MSAASATLPDDASEHAGDRAQIGLPLGQGRRRRYRRQGGGGAGDGRRALPWLAALAAGLPGEAVVRGGEGGRAGDPGASRLRWLLRGRELAGLAGAPARRPYTECTGRRSYLRAALRYLHGSSPYDIVGYGNVAPLAAADLCGRLGAPAPGGGSARHRACAFLRRSGGQGVGYARADAFGQAGYFTWGTTASNGAGGALAAISGVRGGRRVAAGARDYLLGRNPWGASFVAGYGPHSPRKVHSWASHFGDGRPDGAVVGGPAPIGQLLSQGFHPGGPLRAFNSRIVYEDRRSDYVTSEPTLDSAACSILLLAALDRR